MNDSSREVPILLWPFYTVWRLLTFILSIVGRLLCAMLGVVTMMVGIAVTLSVIGAPLGIPLMGGRGSARKAAGRWFFALQNTGRSDGELGCQYPCQSFGGHRRPSAASRGDGGRGRDGRAAYPATLGVPLTVVPKVAPVCNYPLL